MTQTVSLPNPSNFNHGDMTAPLTKGKYIGDGSDTCTEIYSSNHSSNTSTRLNHRRRDRTKF